MSGKSYYVSFPSRYCEFSLDDDTGMRVSDFFIIFSLSRSGSSALFRALNSHAVINLAYEPSFARANWDDKEIREIVERIKRRYSGMKHVWDPSGFPFVPQHDSSLSILASRHERVIRLNSFILSLGARVIFLRRRNHLERLLSDLLGQQTNLWTPSFPDFPTATIETVVSDSTSYKRQVSAQEIRPLDTAVVDWYMENLPRMESAIRSALRDEVCLDVYYEDLFDPTVTSDVRVSNYVAILQFLEQPLNQRYWNRVEIAALFDPRAKLNSRETIGLIPNIDGILARYPEFA